MAKGNHNSNFPTNQQPDIEPSEMKNMVFSMEKLRELPKINPNDPEQLEERIKYFFTWCAENHLRPGVELMALSIGVTRKTLWMWEQAGGTKGEIITRSKQVLAALTEQWGITGKINPVTLIFLLKNHFSYRDTVELQASTATSLDTLPTKEEVTKRIPTILRGEAEPGIDDIIENI